MGEGVVGDSHLMSEGRSPIISGSCSRRLFSKLRPSSLLSVHSASLSLPGGEGKRERREARKVRRVSAASSVTQYLLSMLPERSSSLRMDMLPMLSPTAEIWFPLSSRTIIWAEREG